MTTPNPQPDQPKCIGCGAPLNEGEAKTFTVCDSCWDKAYPSDQPSAEALKLANKILLAGADAADANAGKEQAIKDRTRFALLIDQHTAAAVAKATKRPSAFDATPLAATWETPEVEAAVVWMRGQEKEEDWVRADFARRLAKENAALREELIIAKAERAQALLCVTDLKPQLATLEAERDGLKSEIDQLIMVRDAFHVQRDAAEARVKELEGEIDAERKLMARVLVGDDHDVTLAENVVAVHLENKTLRTRLTASDAARRGLVEALEEIRDGRREDGRVWLRDGPEVRPGVQPRVPGPLMTAYIDSALAASAKLDGNP